jgi:hypothetical protein
MAILLKSLESTRATWNSAPEPPTYPEAIADLGSFAEYKKTSKRGWVRERQELAALYSNIQTKLKTYALRVWEPVEGLRLEVSIRLLEVKRVEGLIMVGPGEAMVCFSDS